MSTVGRILRRRGEEAQRPATPSPPPPDPDLLALQARLTERFAVMQSELGGLFYEMAIRDHVRMEVLIPRAAELQRLDAELGQVERMLEDPGARAGGNCPACGAIHARGAAFCSQCATQLTVD